MYFILVPYMDIPFLGITFKWTLVIILILLGTLKRMRLELYNLKFKLLAGFLFYYIICFFLMPLQSGEPYLWAINSWRGEFITYMIIPFCIWNVVRYDTSVLCYFRISLLISIAIACVYGLILTMMPGVNPYMILMQALHGAEFNDSYALAVGEGRLFGRISSVFTHPMAYAFFLGASMIYVIHIRRKLARIIYASMITIIVLNMITCGVRTVIASAVIAVGYIFFRKGSIRLLIKIGLILLFILFVVSLTPDLNDYLFSMFDSSSSEVKGSSLDQRVSQLSGVFYEIRHNILLGNGFNWRDYYLETKGNHPILLAFESIIFVILCNNGLFGIFIWLIIALLILKVIKFKGVYESRKIHQALLIYFFMYAFITGVYLQLYILFFTLMMAEDYVDKKSALMLSKSKLSNCFN